MDNSSNENNLKRTSDSELIGNSREKYLKSRLGSRDNVTSPRLQQDESYDNLNQSTLDYITDAEAELISETKNESAPDYQSQINSQSFIISKCVLNDSIKSDQIEEQLSEEIEDEDEDEDQNELRNYDDDELINQQNHLNEDEFFLISTPSPYNQSLQEDADYSNRRYELNRLSNIIEEDEETQKIDPECVENYKEMLKLGEEVKNIYKNIENELSKPQVQTSYVPVMKKRVYNLNRSYLPNSNCVSIQAHNKEPEYQLEEEEPDSILNYLINRLSEQHKTKLEPLLNTNISASKISAEFDEFEKHLFDKYSLNDSSKKTDPILDSKLPLNDTGYLLTRSLYAEHKKINIEENLPEKQVVLRNSNLINNNNKVITALSINEIETRKSVRLSDDSTGLNSNPDESFSDSESNEKKIKEEIVLIGEKSDIDCLLDNQNNQLFNLIIANSTKANRLSEIESDLSEKRLSKIQDEKLFGLISEPNSAPESYDIEIQVENDKTIEKKEPEVIETDLKEVAKYLVDEITKISLNKVKIDDLNEKYSTSSPTSNKLINNLVHSDHANKSKTDINNFKNKEELFNYYENLEKNLQQVREEIDKLKQEAVEDLQYLNQILNDQNELIDYDQVYLKPEEEVEDMDEDDNDDDDDDEETQYLSQPGSQATTINQQNDVSSQIYLTPAESFQAIEKNDEDLDRTLRNNNSFRVEKREDIEYTNGNQTDQDEVDNLDDQEDSVSEEITLKNEFDPNSIKTQEITEIVKNILSRPNVPAPVVPSKSIETELDTKVNLIEKEKPPILKSKTEHDLFTRSRSQGPDELKSSRRNINSTTPVLVNKNTMDKFIKLASNSASLLDLNQIQPSLSNNSINTIKQNSSQNITQPAPVPSRPSYKPRKNFDNQVENLIKQKQDNLITKSTKSLINSNCSTTFRVPSSRHFCGRLLSISTNSQCQSESESSSTDQQQIKRFLSSEEEISIETDDEDEQLNNNLSTSSPSPSSSSSPNSNSPPYRPAINQRKSVLNEPTHHHHKKLDSVELKKQQSLAKSVDFLIDDNINNENNDRKIENKSKNFEANLSKSIKDLRSYVSNSFSPSQIVRPPSINNSVEHKPIIMSRENRELKTMAISNSSKNLLTMQLKTEKSDQIRLEYLQQEQMIARIEKQHLKENIIHKNMGNYKNKDDQLINCILEMKPLPSKQVQQSQPKPQPRSLNNTNTNLKPVLSSKKDAVLNISIPNNPPLNSTSNQIKQIYLQKTQIPSTNTNQSDNRRRIKKETNL